MGQGGGPWAVVLLIAACAGGAPAIQPTSVNEGGVGGIRSGATITISGATWNTASTTAAPSVEAALNGMTSSYTSGCTTCTPPNIYPWSCTFTDRAGPTPALVTCKVRDATFDIPSPSLYTLPAWTDDAGKAWSGLQLRVFPTRGGAVLVGNATSPPYPPSTTTLSEPASGKYPGGTVTIPTLILTEEDVRFGGESVVIALTGEAWNDGSTKAAVTTWTTEVSLTSPASPTSTTGFTALKSSLLPGSSAYTFPTSELLVITFSTASLYDIAQHEVIHATVSDRAVQSSPPYGGSPDGTLRFEIWPIPGVVNFTTAGPIEVPEDIIRSGGLRFELTIDYDTWHPSFRQQLLVSAMQSDVPIGIEPNGWNARKTLLLPNPQNIVRRSGVLIEVTLEADPGYDISEVETITFQLPGCPNYRLLRATNGICRDDYLTKSQLAPRANSLSLIVRPTRGMLSLRPNAVVTECEIRSGLSITLTLTDEYWNYNDWDAVRTTLYNKLQSDVPAAPRPAGEPAGFNALKASLVQGGTPPAGVVRGASNREVVVTITPNTGYDISQNETLDLAAVLMNDNPAAAKVLFRSGMMPAFDPYYNASLTVVPGPCHDLAVSSSCRRSTTCGGGAQCTCMVFDEEDIRQGAARITLTLPGNEQWAANVESELWNFRWTSDSPAAGVKSQGFPAKATTDRLSSGAAAVDPTTYLPWGFLSRWNASYGAMPNPSNPPLVTLSRVSSQVLVLTISDKDYDTPAEERIALYLPPGTTVSNIPPSPAGSDAVTFTILPVAPQLSLAPSGFELYHCDIKGPAHKTVPTPLGDGYRVGRAGMRCQAASTTLGTGTSLTNCAQLCHDHASCDFFEYGVGVCRASSTADETCPEGFTADTVSFYIMSRIQFSVSLQGGTWDITGDDVQRALSPGYFKEQFTSAVTLRLASNNTLVFTVNPSSSFQLPTGDETVTFTISPTMTACSCHPTPRAVSFVLRRCPGSLLAERFDFEEKDVWEGQANITLELAGDTWKDPVSLSRLRDSIVPVGIPSWNTHRDCVLSKPPTILSPTHLVFTLGPCPAFDINTDPTGKAGVFAPMWNESVYLAVKGDMVASGVPPVGGNQEGFRSTAPEGRVYLNFSSSQGTVRVDPNPTFSESDVREGKYRFTLVMDPGESFANPGAIDLVQYMMTHTTALTTQPRGGGWGFLSTVLLRHVTIVAPDQMVVIWQANTNYNIDLPDLLCVEITGELTASGLQPLASDGTYCVKPAPILPDRGCVRMEPFPYTVTEEEVRRNGIAFDLVLDGMDRWVTNMGSFHDLLANMTVADPTANTLGWEQRKPGYSTTAFTLDPSGSRLSVRIPSDSAGSPSADPLYDIIETETVEIHVPETVIGSGVEPCVRTPENGTLHFNITVIPGSVHMAPTEFTEGDIRTGGGTVVITIVGNTWSSPWDRTHKEAIRSNLLSACSPPCPWPNGFARWRDDAVTPLVNMTMLLYNNDKLEIVLNPVPGFDIPHDEWVTINLPPSVVATGFFPKGWDKLRFVIRASTATLPNTPSGVITPGIPEAAIRAGTAPPIYIHLRYETWDLTESSRMKASFCGSSGDCSDLSNPTGFNALRDTLFPTTVTFQSEAGLTCPPNCPATVAVVQFLPAPIDICASTGEEVFVSLDPMLFTSHPATPPTPLGIGSPDVLAFNITGDSLADPFTLRVDLPVTEQLIRSGGLQVTVYANDGPWDVTHPNFVATLRDSIQSSLPNTEPFSFAGPLIFDLLSPPVQFENKGGSANRAVVFNISSPLYDIPERYPSNCIATNCPWSTPTATDNLLECNDGSTCNVLTNGWGCCSTRQGRRRCPRNWPYMCANMFDCEGGTEYCCMDVAASCNSPAHGGVRPCGGCTEGETLFFNVDPSLTVCRLTPPRNRLNLDIKGESWRVDRWSLTSSTFEATDNSAYADEPMAFVIEGSELHSINDTAALSTGMCRPGAPVDGSEAPLAPRTVTVTAVAGQGAVAPGPGLRGVEWAPRIASPGYYHVCYKDFRDPAFTHLAGPQVTVIGKAFSFVGEWGGGEVNVTLPSTTTSITLYGRGFCTGPAPAGAPPGRHTGGGCDSVKIMRGWEADCNPGYPSADDGSGRLTGPTALQPLTASGVPVTDGTVNVELSSKGSFTVCYASRWADYWQPVGSFNVTPAVRRWDACDQDGPAYATPTTGCKVVYTAIAGRPQRIYISGRGLTSTEAESGWRLRHKRYKVLGVGECIGPLGTPGPRCKARSVMTLKECQRYCDIFPGCDGVQYGSVSGECYLEFPLEHWVLRWRKPTPSLFDCTANPAGQRTSNSLLSTGVATTSGDQCFSPLDEDDPTDIGDMFKVIRYGEDCQTSAGVPSGFLAGPAVLPVDGVPNLGPWDGTMKTCSPVGECRTGVTTVTLTFLRFGRYTLCYQFGGEGMWYPIPDTDLRVDARITAMQPGELVASEDPPTVEFFGYGILAGEFEARMVEWPLNCDSPVVHPDVHADLWQDRAVVGPGVEAPFQPSATEVLGVANWTFAKGTALLPRWWAQSGVYLFCYRFPGLTHWLPIDYVRVRPRVTRATPPMLLATPHHGGVEVHGEGLDTRLDVVKVIPAVLGSCDMHSDEYVLVSTHLDPKQGGRGLRGQTVVTLTGQAFGAAGLFRVCYGWANYTEDNPRGCSMHSRCTGAVGMCCPADNGVWDPCCDHEYTWHEAYAGDPCPVPAVFPPSWPDWYIRQVRQCIPPDTIAQQQLSWKGPAAVRVPCPEFFCGLQEVVPLVGLMVVEDHLTVETPPVLDAGEEHRVRFEGQGFSVGDIVYMVDGFRADCSLVVPGATPNAFVEAIPTTPRGEVWGLPNVLWRARFTHAGDYTVCLAFQLYPGLVVPAGNITVRASVTAMAWSASTGVLRINFTGGGLDTRGGIGDSAMLIPASGNCNESLAVATTDDLLPGNSPMLSEVYWLVPHGSITVAGSYKVCYRMRGVWSLLQGDITWPFGNVPPAFNVVAGSDRIYLYGPVGVPLTHSAPFANNITTAKGGLHWLPAERRQSVQFEVVVLAGDATIFSGQCLPRMAAECATQSGEDSCKSAGCAWDNFRCIAPSLGFCRGLAADTLCNSSPGCLWSKGAFPSVDNRTGLLTFTIADAANIGTLELGVTLVDNGGTANGGEDRSESRKVVLTITEGPEFDLITNTITLWEDDPAAFNQPLVSWSVQRVAGRVYRYSISWEDPKTPSTYFAGGFNISEDGTYSVALSPDRFVEAPGKTAQITLRDTTLGVVSTPKILRVIINPVNDKPSFELLAKYRAAPSVLTQLANPLSFREQVVPMTSRQCQSDEATACIRMFVAGGCSTDSTDLGFSCVPYSVCSRAACSSLTATCATEAAQKCAKLVVTGGCNLTRYPTVDGSSCYAHKDCLEASCSAPDTSFSLGPFEDHQHVAFEALVDPADAAMFSTMPSVTPQGMLTFTITPTRSGIIKISIVAKDDGGTVRGGVDTSDARLFTIASYTLPRLVVTPSAGGRSLETVFQLEAVGGSQLGGDVLYHFATLPHVQTLPLDLNKNIPIVHTIDGPQPSPSIQTVDIPEGKHTCILFVSIGGRQLDPTSAFIAVEPPAESRLASSLNITGGDPKGLLARLAAVGHSVPSVPAAGGSTTRTELLNSVQRAVEGLRASTGEGSLSTAVLDTGLAALEAAVSSVGSSNGPAPPEDLLLATDSLGLLHKKGAGEGTLTGQVDVAGVHLAGLTAQQVTALQDALRVDMARAFDVPPTDVSVVFSEGKGKVQAQYTVSTIGHENPIATQNRVSSAISRGDIQTTSTQKLYQSFRAVLPTVSYERSSTSNTATGLIKLRWLDLSGVSVADSARIKEAIRADIASSFNMTASSVAVTITQSTTAPNSSSVSFSISSPNAGSVQCAMIPACPSSTLNFTGANKVYSEIKGPGSPSLAVDYDRSSYKFGTSGELILVDVHLAQFGSTQASELSSAIEEDLAGLYGVPRDRLDVQLLPDAVSGGTVVTHTVNTDGLPNPAQVQEALQLRLRQRSVQLPKTQAILTTQPVVAQLVYTQASPPQTVEIKAYDERTVRHFLRVYNSIIAVAGEGSSWWGSISEKRQAESKADERWKLAQALDRALQVVNDVVDSTCIGLIATARRIQADTPLASAQHSTFSAAWQAVLASGATGTVTARLDYGKNWVTTAIARPSVDTCLTSFAYSKSPFPSDGTPGLTPSLPITSVRGHRLKAVEATIPVASTSNMGMLGWDRGSKVWKGTGGILFGGKRATLKWEEGARLQMTHRRLLQAAEEPEERIMAAALLPAPRDSSCFPCILVPVVLLLWLLLTSLGLFTHSTVMKKPERLQSDEEVAKFIFSRPPRLSYSVIRHHAWICYFFDRPTATQIYGRAERATVWFSVYFLAMGIISFFFDADEVEVWEPLPENDLVRGLWVAGLAFAISWIVSIILRLLLTIRERDWNVQLILAGVRNEEGTHHSVRPRWRHPVYFAVACACITMVVICWFRTRPYNTTAQREQYIYAFLICVALHFVFEFVWVVYMYHLEMAEWDSPAHPRHQLNQSEKEMSLKDTYRPPAIVHERRHSPPASPRPAPPKPVDWERYSEVSDRPEHEFDDGGTEDDFADLTKPALPLRESPTDSAEPLKTNTPFRDALFTPASGNHDVGIDWDEVVRQSPNDRRRAVPFPANEPSPEIVAPSTRLSQYMSRPTSLPPVRSVSGASRYGNPDDLSSPSPTGASGGIGSKGMGRGRGSGVPPPAPVDPAIDRLFSDTAPPRSESSGADQQQLDNYRFPQPPKDEAEPDGDFIY